MKSHALGVGWRFLMVAVLALALSSLAALAAPLYGQSSDKAISVQVDALDASVAIPELRVEVPVPLDVGEGSPSSAILNVSTANISMHKERSAPVVLDLRSREAALTLDSFGEHRPLGSIFGSTAALRC